MWLIYVLLLWLAPLVLGLVVFNRIDRGAPAFTKSERRLLFDDTETSHVTVWLTIKFAVLAVVFFVIGLMEGVVLPNLGSVSSALIVLLTGGALTLLAALGLRARAPIHQPAPEPSAPRTPDMFF